MYYFTVEIPILCQSFKERLFNKIDGVLKSTGKKTYKMMNYPVTKT